MEIGLPERTSGMSILFQLETIPVVVVGVSLPDATKHNFISKPVSFTLTAYSGRQYVSPR